MGKKSVRMAAVLALLAAGTQARAAELTVLASVAIEAPLKQIAADFMRRTGVTVDLESDTTGGVEKRLRAGAAADLVIVSGLAMDALEKEHLVAAAGRTDIAVALIGVGVRAGAPAPDISSVAAFTRTLLAARSIAFVDPATGGVSGTYFTGLLQRLGIARAIEAKTRYQQKGSEVADAVADGQAELGITFISELLPNRGVQVTGALPDGVQSPTIYTAAFAASAHNADAARGLVIALGAPGGRATLEKAGLKPRP